MDPVIEEMQRARFPVRADVLRRWARHLRDEVQPLLDEAERLRDEAQAGVSVKAKKTV